MKKNIVKLIIALLMIVVIMLVLLYISTDLLKTPEQLFYKHLITNSKLLNDMSYEDILEKVQNEKNTSQEAEGEITAKITSNDESMEQVEKILEKAKITYNRRVIGPEQKMQNDIKLIYNNNNLLELNILKNKEQYGIKIEELHNQYVSIENKDLKSVFEKLEMDSTNISDEILNLDYVELLNIDKKTLNHIKSTYFGILNDNISEESYSVKNNVTVKIDNNDINTNAYELTLTDKQVNIIYAKILETLKDDDKTLDLIITKNDMLESALANIDEEKLTKESLIKEIEEEITRINQKEHIENKTLNIVVYGEKNGNAKIEVITKREDKELSKIEVDIIKTKDNNRKIVVSGSEENKMAYIELLYNEKKTDLIIKIGDEELKIELNLKEEIKETENFTIEEFNSENSVKINDMTKTEIEQLVGKIYLNSLYTLPKKIFLLGIDLKELYNPLQNNTAENVTL